MSSLIWSVHPPSPASTCDIISHHCNYPLQLVTWGKRIDGGVNWSSCLLQHKVNTGLVVSWIVSSVHMKLSWTTAIVDRPCPRDHWSVRTITCRHCICALIIISHHCNYPLQSVFPMSGYQSGYNDRRLLRIQSQSELGRILDRDRLDTGNRIAQLSDTVHVLVITDRQDNCPLSFDPHVINNIASAIIRCSRFS